MIGIVPVEAQAAGRPVIALSRGGGRETVVPIGAGDPPTGVWFSHQSAQGVSQALDQFLAFESSFDPVKIRDNALRFSRDRFREKILGVAEEMLSRPG